MPKMVHPELDGGKRVIDAHELQVVPFKSAGWVLADVEGEQLPEPPAAVDEPAADKPTAADSPSAGQPAAAADKPASRQKPAKE